MSDKEPCWDSPWHRPIEPPAPPPPAPTETPVSGATAPDNTTTG